jgi:predicted nucleotidyltransferase
VAATLEFRELAMTGDKVQELVERIVEAVDPLQVIAFGSRARGTHGSDSDLDLAVIVDGTEAAHASLPDGLTAGLLMDVDLLTIPKERFDKFRPWINTVHRQIDREGVRLYERGRQSATPDTFRRLC